MTAQLGLVALLVREYDEAIAWFTQHLGFELVEDTLTNPPRRWVVVAPAGARAPGLLLARAASAEQQAAVGRQGAGRVFLFLETDDFARDHAAFVARGVHFVEAPRHEPYGTVAVFEDLYGNRWDLVERRGPARAPGGPRAPQAIATTAIHVRRLDADAAVAASPALADLLIDCVEGGASVGFTLPMTEGRATRFWRQVADGVARGERVLLVAEDGAGQIVGTVQLVLALPDNQPHRADLVKMLVHGSGRRRGVARRLLAAAEAAARGEGRTVLVLDAVTDGPAARLYASAGWRRVGDIPHFALMPDGSPCSTTYFYKALAP